MKPIIDNKHYTIHINEIEFSGDNKLLCDMDIAYHSTRATRFQAKKLLARKLRKLLWAAVRGDIAVVRSS